MRLYAESSAVLSWLLEEKTGAGVGAALSGASRVLSSELTLLECDRVLIRAVALGAIAEPQAHERRAVLHRATRRWDLLRVAKPVIERACTAFPVEPLRTLDALHLATALLAAKRVRELVMLTRDKRLRENAQAFGLPVLP